ncbi:hypothetical protein HMF8227_00951 [Saliniradius amylolyticus]|uniref:Solute-binding protein family 3/N-terminal domain-containing protein n=1 Tax=Saliniradius amylolyticus TaxID=2183582 RepID=A0A2S2E1C5_9ALTE|nr:transporter substrate-binding domain-containing protein [Saliniradius amylolyticus]AWL11444.1 hypothetical protein HMF8227_00951 [Saliniradius amylolyticus]
MRVLLVLLLLTSVGVSAATWKLVYPRQLSDHDYRSRYPVELLSLALEATGVNYNLIPSDRILFQTDAIQRLKANRDINVLWSMTDKLREEEMLPVRIPVYKGLIGTRLLLIRPSNRKFFQGIQSLEQLAKYRAVSGQNWPDTKILQTNGIDVVTDPEYEPLFELLKSDRGVMFPRSIVEIYSELEEQVHSQGLMVEPELALYYPTAMYFFVNRKNVTLKQLIEGGLKKILSNGKFDELFFNVHRPLLKRAKLGQRTILRLENPILPEQTPLERSELWHPVAFD